MVVVLSLCREILSWLLEIILSLIILHSAIPWATVPLAVVLKLILVGWRVIKRSILSKVLVEILLWWVAPIVVSIRAICLAVERGSTLLVRWESVISILVSVAVEGTVLSVLSVVSIWNILLLLLWLFFDIVRFLYR